MNLGYIGLSISFLIVLLILLVIFTKAKVDKKFKLLLIPLTIWYSLVLYSIPNNFSGWATESEPPDKSIILGLWVQEPTLKEAGGVYFWVVHYPSQEEVIKFSLNPKEFVTYIYSQQPRNYKISYDKGFHKKLLEAQKNQAQEKGSILQYRKGTKPGSKKGKGEFRDDSGFKLLRPEELLPKAYRGVEG